MLTLLDDSLSSNSPPGSVLVWKKLEELAFEAKALELSELCTRSNVNSEVMREAHKRFLAGIYVRVMAPNHQLSQEEVVSLWMTEYQIRHNIKESVQSKILDGMIWILVLLLIGGACIPVYFFGHGAVKWFKNRTQNRAVQSAAPSADVEKPTPATPADWD
jgi:hypothetical protein